MEVSLRKLKSTRHATFPADAFGEAFAALWIEDDKGSSVSISIESWEEFYKLKEEVLKLENALITMGNFHETIEEREAAARKRSRERLKRFQS